MNHHWGPSINIVLKIVQSLQDIGIVMGNHDFITTQELFQIIMVFAKHFLNMLKFLSVSDRKIILNNYL